MLNEKNVNHNKRKQAVFLKEKKRKHHRHQADKQARR